MAQERAPRPQASRSPTAGCRQRWRGLPLSAPTSSSPAEEASLPSNVSERRLRAEVQAMLVGADLAAVTIGQLRGELEARLGLERGRLSSETSLQRWISSIVQHEVVKKGQRSAFCERVAQALVEFEGYSAEARQMLIESLPHAIPSSSKPLHMHQERLLAIARDAIGSAKDQAARVQTEILERTRFEDADLDALMAERDATARREAAAHEASEAAADLLRGAEEEVRLTKSQLQKAEDAIREAHRELQRAEQTRQDAVALRDGELLQLLEGTVQEDGRAAAIAKVSDFLRRANAEASLLAAAPVALRHGPEARTAYENAVVDALKSCFAEQMSRAEAQLAVQPEVALGPALSTAKLAAETACARAAERVASRDGARVAWEAAAAQLRTEEAAVSEKLEAARPRREESERLGKRVQELDGIIGILDGLIASSSKSPAAPPPSSNEADVTSPDKVAPLPSPRKVATPMSERRGGQHEASEPMRT
mmetsp:Transcript_36401/g.113262  ORF Transcript_36401/g.113262 Transcript_36401/m.113262 type:complete len:483 (-) Transcript_36401:291-1739(-)